MGDGMTKTDLSVIVTTKGRVKELPIIDGQLVFVRDGHRIAFDYGNKRVFYNQIVELATEQERLSVSPVEGEFYFVIETAVLWRYEADWIQLTNTPEEIIFIGTELPKPGSAKKIYVDKESSNISVWDDDLQEYRVVGEKTNAIPDEDIKGIFSTNDIKDLK